MDSDCCTDFSQMPLPIASVTADRTVKYTHKVHLKFTPLAYENITCFCEVPVTTLSWLEHRTRMEIPGSTRFDFYLSSATNSCTLVGHQAAKIQYDRYYSRFSRVINVLAGIIMLTLEDNCGILNTW